jgi:EmrB/QacA subfamily drug resistance transporter
MMRSLQSMDYKWRAAVVVALGLFLSVLDSTIVSVALPAMRQTFHTDFNTITWVVSAYFLAQAAVIPITGYLSDRVGTRAIFLTAMGVFILGSALCALSGNEKVLIASRVVQGIGGGALFPTSFAIAYRAFPRDEWGRATAIIGVPVLLAPSLGPLIGGWLTSSFDWQAIFVINIPIGLLALAAGAAFLRRRAEDAGAERIEPTGRFDIPGFILAIAGFTVLVYGLTEAGIEGWGSSIAVRALAISAVLLAALVVFELRARNPVLDMRIFRYLTFSRAIVLIWLVTGFYYGSLFLIPFFFEKVEGLSPLTSGEIMIAQGVAAAIGIAAGGELYNKIGPRPMAVVGMASLALSGIGFTHLSVTSTGLSLQLWLALRGLGLGLTTTPLQNLALSVVDRRDLTRSTSLINVSRQVFSAAGVAALAAFVAQRAAHFAATASGALHSGHVTGGIATACAHAGAATAGCIQQHAVTDGLNEAFMIGLIACAAAVVLALVVGRDPALEALKGEAPERIAEAFPHLTRDELVEAAGRAEVRYFQAGETVLRQGDRADTFYVISSGEVRVSRQSATGETVELRTLGPGQYFGEIGLLANLPRTATVTAVTVVEILALNRATFTDLVARSEAMADDVRRVMEERMALLP